MVILKYDKGGVVVNLYKVDYQNKMMDHLLNSGIYKKLSKNPINKISKEVSFAINSSNILSPIKKKIIISNPITPKIYGLQKFHK